MTLTTKAEVAWPGGDKPGQLDYIYLLPKKFEVLISTTLKKSFPQELSLPLCFYALQPVIGLVGRYKLVAPEGIWFIRVSSRKTNFPMVKKITDYLKTSGARVNESILSGEILKWRKKEYFIDVRPFLEARHYNGSLFDLENLAKSLFHCHNLLSDFEDAHIICEETSLRTKKYLRIKEMIKNALDNNNFDIFNEYASLIAAHKEWFLELVDNFDPCLEKHPDAQCIHGEIHAGNVLFDLSDNRAILVDFEESPHSFFPVSWDLAYFFQRFCFYDNPTPELLQKRYLSIVSSYGSSFSKVKLTAMMRQAAWMAIANILYLRLHLNIYTSLEEMKKFFILEEQAKNCKGF